MLLNKESRQHLEGLETFGMPKRGSFVVGSYPGEFARSKHHDLTAKMNNMNHVVNELHVGGPTVMYRIHSTAAIEGTGRGRTYNYTVERDLYHTTDLHESYHHYIKLIATNIGYHF